MMKQQRSYSYLALGDSYTIGEQVSFEENFPNQLKKMLEEKNIFLEKPAIIAKTGWTTDELNDAIQKAELQQYYDFVTLLIGVNNQYRGRTVADYIPEFESLLKQAIGFAGNNNAHVIVVSIPDWSVTPFAKDRDTKTITGQIDEYNVANKMIAEKYKVHYVDITPDTRKAANDPSLLTADGLHPSGKEYKIWAERIAALIQNNL